MCSFFFFFSSRRRHTRLVSDWSSDVCSSDLVAGGGGRGIRPVSDERDLLRQFPLAQMEAQSFFGNGALYLEKRVERAHHVEVQLLADGHGTTLAMGERDCTLQRRRQKILEEAPSPSLNADQRKSINELAARGA